jgi:hypothetical protein
MYIPGMGNDQEYYAYIGQINAFGGTSKRGAMLIPPKDKACAQIDCRTGSNDG